MLDDSIKQQIQEAYRQFLSSRSMKPRYGQRLMIAHIARCLAGIKRNQEAQRSGGDHLCVVEAGTGTGKTLAYALAAIPVAAQCRKTLVISTATVALQEQILYRDLPDILQHSGLNFSVSLAKGRRRYLCLSKLDQLISGADAQTLPLYPDEAMSSPDDTSLALYSDFLRALTSGQWDGDRDNWASVVDEAQWAPVTTDHAQCTGRRCSHVRQCSFFRARESLTQADVVVANHDLVLADLALGGGVILPPPEEAIYIFDEAHHLPDKVINHFSASVRVGTTERWLEQAQRGVSAVVAHPAIDDLMRPKWETLATTISSAREAFGRLRPCVEPLMEDVETRRGQAVRRFEDGVVPDELRRLSADLRTAFAAINQHAESLIEGLQKGLDRGELDMGRELSEQCLADLSAIRFRSDAILTLFRSFSANTEDEKPPLARWLAKVESGLGLFDLELNSSPILAAKTLSSTLWNRCYGAVLTSATLTALGRFDRFAMRTGLYDDASFEVVPSPFAHAEAAQLVVPAMACDGGDPEAHTHALIEALPKILDPDAGSLVLFASRKQMHAVYDALPETWRKRTIAQGELPKKDILQRHRDALDEGRGSVIFGLASFAEGVDLPGHYCSHVVIAKIPFAVPEDPVEEALAEWVSRNNGNPFMDITVPDAAIKLVQASGRLLRNEQDRGRISILDRRIVSRHYGRKMLASMPPYQQIVE